MSDTFRLTGILLELDGQRLYDRHGQWQDPGQTLLLFSGSLAAGSHELKARLEFRGNGHGVFSYLNKYRFTVREQHHFDCGYGDRASITIVAFERGGPTTPLEERPALRFERGSL